MAIPFNVGAMMSEPKSRELLGKRILQHAGIDPERFQSIAVGPDAQLGEFVVKVYVKPLPAPKDVKTRLDAVSLLLADPLRAEVIKAAVPEFHKQVMALMQSVRAAFEPQTVTMNERAVFDLLYKFTP